MTTRLHARAPTLPAKRRTGDGFVSPISPASISLLFGGAVIVLMASALLFTNNAFASDFTNMLWLGAAQKATITHGWLPSFFINTTSQAPLPKGYYYPYPTTALFDPIFSFYGGPLFAIFGLCSVICFGNVIAAFIVITLLGFAGAYWGLYLLARRAGCNRPICHAGAMTFVASAYYLSDLYGRGDWIEFIAVSSIPLLVITALDLLDDKAVRVRSVLLFFVACVFFSGSHNTTFLWGTLFFALLALGLLLTRVVSFPRLRRIAVVFGIALLGIGVNAWAIVPALFYSSSTYFVHGEAVIGTTFFDTWQNLFNPFRSVPAVSKSPGLYTQVPVWMLAWSLLFGIYYCLVRPANTVARRAWLLIVVIGGLYFVLLMNQQVWQYLPHTLAIIQAPYLLGTYVSLSIAGLVIVAGASMTRQLRKKGRTRSNVISATVLALCSAMTLGLGAWQVIVPNDRQPVISELVRNQALTGTSVLPKSWYALLDWVNQTVPIVTVPSNRQLLLPASLLNAHGDSIDAVVAAPPGYGPIATNIVATPDFVRISGGAVVIGRNTSGYFVIDRTAPGGAPIHLIVSTNPSEGIVLGRVLTAASLFAILLVIACYAWWRFSARRRSRVSTSDVTTRLDSPGHRVI